MCGCPADERPRLLAGPAGTAVGVAIAAWHELHALTNPDALRLSEVAPQLSAARRCGSEAAPLLAARPRGHPAPAAALRRAEWHDSEMLSSSSTFAPSRARRPWQTPSPRPAGVRPECPSCPPGCPHPSQNRPSQTRSRNARATTTLCGTPGLGLGRACHRRWRSDPALRGRARARNSQRLGFGFSRNKRSGRRRIAPLQMRARICARASMTHELQAPA